MPGGGGGEQRQEEEQEGDPSPQESTEAGAEKDVAAPRSVPEAEVARLLQEYNGTPLTEPDVRQRGEWSHSRSTSAPERLSTLPANSVGAGHVDSEARLRMKWGTIQKDCPFYPQSPSLQLGSPSVKNRIESSTNSFTRLGTPTSLRASAAAFVFTLNAQESMRKSPPLELIASPLKAEEDGVTAVFSSAIAVAGRSKNLTDTQGGTIRINSVATQAAEPIDLNASSVSFGTSRYAHAVSDFGGRYTPFRESVGTSVTGNSGQRMSRHHSTKGDDIMSNNPNSERSFASLSIRNNEDVDSAKNGVRYELVRLREHPDNEGIHEDNMIDAEKESGCCCRCCRVFSCFSRDRDLRSTSLLEHRNDGQREEEEEEFTGRHSGCQCGLCGAVIRSFNFINVFVGNLPVTSQLFCIMNYIASTLVVLALSLILIILWDKPVTRVTDDSTCRGIIVPGVFTPEISFSIAFFLFNALLAVCFSIRAVRYENSGLLVCHCITVLLQLCRSTHFVFFTSIDKLSGQVFLYVQVLFGVSAFLFLASCGTYPWVHMSFGWRTFMKGITRSVLLRRHRRQMFIESFVQLDIFSTISSAFTVVYMLDSDMEQMIGLTVAILSCATALLYLVMLRRRSMWFLSLFSVIFAMSFVFYCYVISSAVEPYLLRGVGAHFEVSQCYSPKLFCCLEDLDAEIISKRNLTKYVENIGNDSSDECSPFVGYRSEYFKAHPRENKNCQLTWQDHFTDGFTHCCELYGHCRLKDAVRSYIVVHLSVLAVILWTVRIILVWLWVHFMKEDEEEATRMWQHPNSDTFAPPALTFPSFSVNGPVST
ncbi:hypothetical protein MOQ_009676 [Trypanosoma cruzi marinkellei]|uniref:Uncharacterized protein n=1 Tax=Trypanosoma cruzi marinkellei TaxID=85056 RepID=K2MLU7_TRYCR|nr:hypothetical protein MOQ_009676 [Trypanosoma cruzi marinkellei]